MNNTEQQIILTIALMPNGGVQVHGPLHNKIMCYGLLEAARDAIRDYVMPEEPRIAIVPAGAMPAPPFKMKN